MANAEISAMYGKKRLDLWIEQGPPKTLDYESKLKCLSSHLDPIIQCLNPRQTFVQSFSGEHFLKCLVGSLGLDPDGDVMVGPGVKPGTSGTPSQKVHQWPIL